MKIALLSPPWIAVPPIGYGGIEYVVSQLTEGLVKRGHDVTLYATGDSKTSAQLEYFHDRQLGNDLFLKQNPYFMLNHLHKFIVQIKNEKFDIVHNNAQYIAQYFLDLQNTPHIHTLHGAFYKGLDAKSGLIDDKRETLLKFKNHNYVSISNQQREGLPELNYVDTIYNGIETDKLRFSGHKGKYLAWLGRITPNKGLDIAIEVSQKTGLPLKIGAFIDKGDKDYYESKIKPHIKGNIEMVGEVRGYNEKSILLNGAMATLFPIKWHEPFGIVMVESMACGTPVIAFNMGSVPEVVEHKNTGFIVERTSEMIDSLENINSIDRSYCRDYSERRFGIKSMIDGYVKAYEKVLSVS